MQVKRLKNRLYPLFQKKIVDCVHLDMEKLEIFQDD
jgi:hypothetical protein